MLLDHRVPQVQVQQVQVEHQDHKDQQVLVAQLDQLVHKVLLD